MTRPITPAVWIRTCQECGFRQSSKPPTPNASEAWKARPCKRCRSPGLDWGSFKSTEEDFGND